LEEEPGDRCAHGAGAVCRGQHGGDDPAADGVPPDPADGLCGAGRALRPPPGSRGGRGGTRALSALSLRRLTGCPEWPEGSTAPRRRSYGGWGQPGSLGTAPNMGGAAAPAANPAGSSEWPGGSIAPGATLLQGVGSAG